MRKLPFCPGDAISSIILPAMCLFGGVGVVEAIRREAVAFADSAPQPQTVAGVYQRHCASCHDRDGSGRAKRTATLELPDFTQRKWQAQWTDEELVTHILDGKGKGMPAFEGRFSREEGRDLVRSLRTLGPAAPRPAQGKNDADREFKKLQDELERLKKESRNLAPRGR